MAKPRLPTALRYGGYVLTLLSFVYIGRIVSDAALPPMQHTVRTWALAAAVCAACAVLPFLSAWVWKLSVELVSRRAMRFDEAFAIYLKSNIAKYLPGNVLQYVGRNYLGAQHGWPHGKLALGSVVEVLAQVAIPIALLCGFWLVGLWRLPLALTIASDRLPGPAALAAAGALVAVLALAVWSRARGVAAGARELWSQGAPGSLAAATAGFAAKVAGLSLVGLLGNTLLFYAIASALLGLDFRGGDFFNIGCALMIAGYAGILTPGVPGGIGVRESMSVILISAYGYDQGGVVMAALLARLFSIAGDAIAFFVATKLGRRAA